MSSIRKREWTSPAGVQKTAWQVDYRDGAGKRRAKQFARKKDAEAWLVEASWQVSRGTHTPDSQSITVKQAGELWLARGRREDLEATTLASYDQHVRLHINPLCGEKKLSQLTKPMVEGFRDRLVEKLTRPMASRVLRSLTAIVAEAQRAGHVAQNVCQGVKVSRKKREKQKVTIPTKIELQKLIQTALKYDDPIALPLVVTVVFAGLRASELRGLSWQNVDLKRARLSIDQRADANGIIGPPKSASGYRTIPIPTLAVQALRTWKLRCPKTDIDLVFPSVAKKVMTHRYMSHNLLAPAMIAAGLFDVIEADGVQVKQPRYTLHQFRHAAASLWIEQRVDPKRVQIWMGHHSIQVTYDIYGHLFERVDIDAGVAEAIERDLMQTEHATLLQQTA